MLSDEKMLFEDIEDVGAIVKMHGLQSPEEFTRILRHYGFGNIDESLVLESFGIALVLCQDFGQNKVRNFRVS